MGGNSYAGTDPDDIVEPWSGGTLVYVSGLPYLVVYGGGHGDSGFNGAVKFGPLYGSGSDTPEWSEFLAASATGAQQDGPTYTDGRQASIHSYNVLCGVGDTLYVPATSAAYSLGNSTLDAFKFTPAGQTALADNISTSRFGTSTYYNGKLYYYGGDEQFEKLRVYTIGTDSWASESNADIAMSNYVGGAVDTTRGKLLVIGGAGGGALTTGAYWDLTALTREVDITRPSGWLYGLVYDPDRDAFVSYVSGSLTVREASASALAAGSGASWSDRTFTGTTPDAAPTQGMFGRFCYVPELKGYIVAPTLEGSVFFMRSA